MRIMLIYIFFAKFYKWKQKNIGFQETTSRLDYKVNYTYPIFFSFPNVYICVYRSLVSSKSSIC